MKLVCALFGFILNIFTAVITGAGYLIKTVGEVLVDTLASVVDAAGNALGLDSALVWILLGVGGYFLLTNSSKKQQGTNSTITVQPAQPIGELTNVSTIS